MYFVNIPFLSWLCIFLRKLVSKICMDSSLLKFDQKVQRTSWSKSFLNVNNAPPNFRFEYNKILSGNEENIIYFYRRQVTFKIMYGENIMKSKKNCSAKIPAVAVESIFTNQSKNCIYDLICIYSRFSLYTYMRTFSMTD